MAFFSRHVRMAVMASASRRCRHHHRRRRHIVGEREIFRLKRVRDRVRSLS